MNWYYVEAGQQAGPVDDAQLEELLRSGKIQPDTLIWQEGMANWQPYHQVKPSATQIAAPPFVHAPEPGASTHEAVCVECGRIFNINDMIRHGGNYVCANCKPVFVQKLSEGARLTTTELRYAGFWIRFAAKFLDNLILTLVVVVPLILIMVLLITGMSSSSRGGFYLEPQKDFLLGAAQFNAVGLIGNVIGLFGQLLFMGVHVLYSTFFLGKYGATPGKMICNLKVIEADGRKIGYGRAFGRGCAEILSRLICFIGYIIAAFDSEKRALHDHMCSTRVVYK